MYGTDSGYGKIHEQWLQISGVLCLFFSAFFEVVVTIGDRTFARRARIQDVDRPFLDTTVAMEVVPTDLWLFATTCGSWQINSSCWCVEKPSN